MKMEMRAQFNTPHAIARRHDEKRGQGERRGYRGRQCIQDNPTQAQRRRTYCAQVCRAVHTLRRIDYLNLLFETMNPHAVDFQQYFPLRSDKSARIAEELKIQHPYASGVPRVLCTPLRVTRELDGHRTYHIINGSDSRGLARCLEMRFAELDERYWTTEQPAHTWTFRTQDQLPAHFRSNVEWLLPMIGRDALYGIDDDAIRRVQELMEPRLRAREDSLVELTDWADQKVGLPFGSAMLISQHLMANHVWKVDLMLVLDPLEPIALL